jgi:hypothetical protein
MTAGPSADARTKFHLQLFTADDRWIMDAPAIIQAQLPDLADVESRIDRVLRRTPARVQLQLHRVSGAWQPKLRHGSRSVSASHTTKTLSVA